MGLTERERKVIREMLVKGNVTEEYLMDVGYFVSDIEDIKDEKEWKILCENVNAKEFEKCRTAVEYVLGAEWKEMNDYKEYRKKGKYGIQIYLTNSCFNRICEVAQDIQITNSIKKKPDVTVMDV